MQVVTVRFTGPMVKPSYHDCEIVEGTMQMKFDNGLEDINRPVCKIISPFGKDNTLKAFYVNEQWNCILD